jgi:hypothetical protein
MVGSFKLGFDVELLNNDAVELLIGFISKLGHRLRLPQSRIG